MDAGVSLLGAFKACIIITNSSNEKRFLSADCPSKSNLSIILITIINIIYHYLSSLTFLWVFVERYSNFMKVVRLYETTSFLVKNLKYSLVNFNFIKVIAQLFLVNWYVCRLSREWFWKSWSYRRICGVLLMFMLAIRIERIDIELCVIIHNLVYDAGWWLLFILCILFFLFHDFYILNKWSLDW